MTSARMYARGVSEVALHAVAWMALGYMLATACSACVHQLLVQGINIWCSAAFSGDALLAAVRERDGITRNRGKGHHSPTVPNTGHRVLQRSFGAAPVQEQLNAITLRPQCSNCEQFHWQDLG